MRECNRNVKVAATRILPGSRYYWPLQGYSPVPVLHSSVDAFSSERKVIHGVSRGEVLIPSLQFATGVS